eukprot:TRINITY_DN24170_c0_g1_i2.p2 TRINITY_DN24170_c0_g1~~TRINITY_DN24170_c0_g1_i2.p2  ORF type:complete len:125 (-),score=33.43 TRINITY_DN24170_c0_g1_i2:58-432(-)
MLTTGIHTAMTLTAPCLVQKLTGRWSSLLPACSGLSLCALAINTLALAAHPPWQWRAALGTVLGAVQVAHALSKLATTEDLRRVWTRVRVEGCLLYTSDAADEEDSVDLGGRRIIKKKKKYDIR